MSRTKVLFFTTGSIASFKAAQVVSTLVKEGFDVQCLATRSALNFVGTTTWEGLSGKKVLADLWGEGHAMDHINLSRDADFGIVCPATAHSLAKMAVGLADDLVSSALLAWPSDKPLYIFPSMNSEMLKSPATQENIAKLRARGFYVSETGQGTLACGETGEGRLLEPEEILRIVRPVTKGKILITGGATRENIDGIRFLSNASTGQTAADLCDEFSRAGFSVTYLHGREARQPVLPAHSIPFTDTKSLEAELREKLGREEFLGAIHAAAVSDYTIAMVNGESPNENSKLQSSEPLSLTLKPTRKILPRIKEFSRNKSIVVIGFKLTLGADLAEQARAARMVLESGADAVVVNDWSKVDHARGAHPGYVKTAESDASFDNHREMAKLLLDELKKDDL